VADSSRSGRSLGTVAASAVAANVAGVWLFLAVLDALPRLSRASGIRLSLAFPAILGATASALAFELIVRAMARLRQRHPVDTVHVRRFAQAQVMLAASTGAGMMLGLILQSTGPTESFDLITRALVGAFWGFSCGMLSATLVWVLAKAFR